MTKNIKKLIKALIDDEFIDLSNTINKEDLIKELQLLDSIENLNESLGIAGTICPTCGKRL